MPKIFSAVANPFKKIFLSRNIVFQVAVNDIKARYAGSLLGMFWSVLYPVIFLGCYAYVYINVLNVSFGDFDTIEYVLLIFCGLIPFIGFQEAVSMGVGCVLSNIGLMKNTMFPIEFIPVKTVIAASTTQATGFLLLLPALIITGKFSVYFLLFVFLWLLQFMFNIGLVWILSSLNVIFRDLQNIITIIIMLLMMLSPIGYPTDAIPENLQGFALFNPLYYIIGCYQQIFIYSKFPDLDLLIPFFLQSFLLFVIGFYFFVNMKKVFTDNV